MFKNLISLNDVFAFVGLASIGYGAWLIYQPAAFITVGLVLLWLGVRR